MGLFVCLTTGIRLQQKLILDSLSGDQTLIDRRLSSRGSLWRTAYVNAKFSRKLERDETLWKSKQLHEIDYTVTLNICKQTEWATPTHRVCKGSAGFARVRALRPLEVNSCHIYVIYIYIYIYIYIRLNYFQSSSQSPVYLPKYSTENLDTPSNQWAIRLLGRLIGIGTPQTSCGYLCS